MMLMESIQLADMARSEESIKYALRGGIIALALLALNGTIYPLSVRLVKKVFGFKDFFYVHFVVVQLLRPFCL